MIKVSRGKRHGLKDTLIKMERLYSRKYGLVNHLITSDLRHLQVIDGANRYTVGSTIPVYLTIASRNQDIDSEPGGAASLIRDKSRVKALGEFMERTCGFIENNVEASNAMCCDNYLNMKSRGMECVSVDELVHYGDLLYNDPAFPFDKVCRSTSIKWFKGFDLNSFMPVWLPAQKVYLTRQFIDEKLYCYGLSTGLACGENLYHAALGAIYEVIERDSFMLTWLLSLPGVRIDMDTIRCKELKETYKHINKHLTGKDRLYIYDISRTDGIFTVMTYFRNDLPNAFGLIVAAASHVRPETAILKSLEELCQTQHFAYSHFYKDEKKEMQSLRKEEINTLHKHTFYYSTGHRSKNIDFISRDDKCIKLSDMSDKTFTGYEDELDYIRDCLMKKNCYAYLADITLPEFRGLGFCVVKAIIPGYNDLTPNHNFRELCNPRLLTHQIASGNPLTDNPHPFP